MSLLGFYKLTTLDEEVLDYSNAYKRSGYRHIENIRNLVIKRENKQFSVYDNFRKLDTFGSFEDAQNYIVMFDNTML